MGNYQFHVNQAMHPKRGEIVVIKDSHYTSSKKYPREILYQGSRAQVLHTGNLYKSRPTAPDITCSIIMLPNKRIDTYFTNNLV